jgi:hypothetical protein
LTSSTTIPNPDGAQRSGGRTTNPRWHAAVTWLSHRI